MITLLIERKQAVEAVREAGRAALEEETLRSFEVRDEALLHQGERENPPPAPAERATGGGDGNRPPPTTS